MSRQVDVKSLVSHIIRGDGTDKCRICLGDTSEGQVYLGDTVMLDGNKPVTLAELLETITGIEVLLEDAMPRGLCSICTMSALDAGNFRLHCQASIDVWKQTVQLLEHIPEPLNTSDHTKSMYLVLNGNELMILNDHSSIKDEDSGLLDEQDERDLITNGKKVIPYHCTRNDGNLNKYTKRHKKYSCPDCGKTFVYAQLMHKHFQHSTELKRACFICAQVLSRDELITHLRIIHKQKPYPCKECPSLLLNSDQYLNHMVKSHGPGGHNCGDCGHTFQSPHALYAHLRVHNGKACPGCDIIFRNHMCYLYHVKRCCNLDITRKDKHVTKTRITLDVRNSKSKRNVKVGLRGSADKECFCDYCGKKYSGKKFVAAHIQIVHMKNTHRPCPYCGKCLAAAHMTQHIKKHEETLSFTCPQCGIVLRSKLGYSQHIRLHTGEMPYACQYCGETFSASSRRSVHVRKVHKSSEVVLRHGCLYCPARFRLPYKLRKHLAAAHAEEANVERPQFQCNICLEKFGSCRGLVHHSRKHQQFRFKACDKVNADVAGGEVAIDT